ncbi:MAG: L-carnitine dehydratase/bile acid-inducible protein [Actinomycetia bacterium]|nr:L-carnitine dehydratase/bile acid-inducible protein [Actinomycetes bacterium]
MTNVMDGIRVLEVAEHTFVPLAGAVLASWGADVIKIEHPERGDAMRGIGSSGGINVGSGGVHILMEHANRGKRSLGLDLSDPAGLELLYKLVETSDVFLTNKLPAVQAKLHITPDEIRAHNPDIVYVQGSGYGSRGPDVDAGGYDSLGFWARSGVAAANTPPELGHILGQSVPAFGDSIGAMFIAGGISTALLHRERTGEATFVDTSLLASGMWSIGAGIGLSLQMGQAYANPTPGNVRNPLVGMYRTSDDRWISLCMLQGFHYWPEASTVLGHPEWIDDPRFASSELLLSNGGAAADLVQEAFLSETFDTWKKRLTGIKGQWAPVQNTVDIAEDPMVIANGFIGETATAEGIPFRLVTPPIQFDNQAGPALRSPEFNEHGDAILQGELGVDDDALIDLKIRGVVA